MDASSTSPPSFASAAVLGEKKLVCSPAERHTHASHAAAHLSDSCVTAALKGAGAGFLGGSLLGAVFSNWSDRPLAVHNQKALPALQKTAALMGQHGGTLGAVGVVYAGVECAMREVRGADDVWNGVVGGVLAGLVLGARSGSVRVAVVGGMALAGVSASVDASGYRLTGGRVDDELSPQRAVFPYNNST